VPEFQLFIIGHGQLPAFIDTARLELVISNFDIIRFKLFTVNGELGCHV
jgi:hypothetical protein